MCGSGITADEKFKNQKDGTVHRHVYYKCTKVRDKECKCGYINEIDLVTQLEALMENIDLDELGIKEKIKKEVARFKKFQKVLLGITQPIQIDDIDIRDYTRFILRDGEDHEKRELLSCLKSKIALKEKVVVLATI